MASHLMVHKTLDNILVQEKISQYLDSKKKIFAFQKSSAGATGITFLPLGFDFGWVVKWQNLKLSEVEYVGAQFYKRAFTHLSIPLTIFNLSDAFRKKLHQYFNGKVACEHFPMLIEYKNGNNLNKLYEYEHLLKFSSQELKKMFYLFGEIAGYDFLIANCDRFIPVDLSSRIDEKHSANGGNILIEMKVPASLETPSVSVQLKDVHMIDNTPHILSFFDSSETRMNIVSDDHYDTFDLQSMYSEMEAIETCSKVEKVALVSTPVSVTGEELRKKRHQCFLDFMHSDPKQLIHLAEQIITGIKNVRGQTSSRSQLEIEQFYGQQSNAQAMLEGLYEGLIAAQNTIRNADLKSILEGLKVECKDFSSSAQIMLSFIQQNLEAVQK